MRSFIAAALCLSLLQTCAARIPHSYRQLAQRDADLDTTNVFLNFFNKLFRRQDMSDGTCYQDDYYNFVYNSSSGQTVCELFVDYPNETTTIDYTPVRYRIVLILRDPWLLTDTWKHIYLYLHQLRNRLRRSPHNSSLYRHRHSVHNSTCEERCTDYSDAARRVSCPARGRVRSKLQETSHGGWHFLDAK